MAHRGTTAADRMVAQSDDGLSGRAREGGVPEAVRPNPRCRSVRSEFFGKPDLRTTSEKRRDAADAKWEFTDRREGTRAARRAFMERFERLAGPEGTPTERARRVQGLVHKHFQKMGRRSALARRAKGAS